MVVTLPGDVVGSYERFSLYNSPYPAHDHGHAIDLYPGRDVALSPVSGEVMETRTVRCPPKPYATDEDHLILIDRGTDIARILHVDPTVEAGEVVTVGDPLGQLVRSGFFARWVDRHIHLGFRERDQNLERASGSRRLEVDVDVTPVRWDGTGSVVEVGRTYVRLDSPPYSESGFAAIASDDGRPIDGGLPHYSGGGVLGDGDGIEELSLFDIPIGTANGRDVRWHDVAVFANGRRSTGLSLFATRVAFGAKLVFHEGHDFSVGDRIEVTIEPVSDPLQLGEG